VRYLLYATPLHIQSNQDTSLRDNRDNAPTCKRRGNHTRHPSWRGSECVSTAVTPNGRLAQSRPCRTAVEARLLSWTRPPLLCPLPEDDSGQCDSPYHSLSMQWADFGTLDSLNDQRAVRDYPSVIFFSSHSRARPRSSYASAHCKVRFKGKCGEVILFAPIGKPSPFTEPSAVLMTLRWKILVISHSCHKTLPRAPYPLTALQHLHYTCTITITRPNIQHGSS
jgi:hypothetical protein